MEQQASIRQLFSPAISGMGESLVKKTRGDRVIWALIILLTIASLLVIYSSTGSLAFKKSKSAESFLFKQLGFVALGLMMIYLAHLVNYTIYSRIATILFLLSIPLLVYTLFFGVQLNSGSRWVKVPVINQTFQSSDFAKLALFMFISRMLSRKQQVIKDFHKGYLPLILPVAIICLLIAPANLSTAILIAGTSLLLMFIGRVRLRHIGLTIGIAMIPVSILIALAVHYYDADAKKQKPLPAVLSWGRVPTWMSRIQTYVYSTKEDTSDKNYQSAQAKIAIANGGWFGLGPGNSNARNFLPHSYSDFIYSIILEEYGILGGAFVLFVYLLFLFRCIRLYQKCPYAFGAFLSLALSFTLVIQAIVHMGVNVSLFPNTGVTLPLMSMGGSSLFFTCFSIGIILSVARNVEQLEGAALPAGSGSADTPTSQQTEEQAQPESAKDNKENNG
jgi:cell division protein FtsW